MAQVNTVRYFCPGSCTELVGEQQRDTGDQYFSTAGEEDGLIPSQTSQQQDVVIAQPEPKPEPGTFYSIPETCVSAALPVETEPEYFYEVDEVDDENQPNSSDLRVETGFKYYGTGSFVEIIGVIPDEQTILARQLQEMEEESEFPSVKYFCTPSTENVRVERQRSTGLSYFGGIDYRSVRYFCPGPCDHMPPELERDTGLGMFIGGAYDEGEYKVNPVPEFGNLCDIRIISGCHYYGGGSCVTKIDTYADELQSERYFCPGSCLELEPEQERETGLQYFGTARDVDSSADSLARIEVEDVVDEYHSVKYFCTPSCDNVAVEVPRETGKRYFTGKPTTTTTSAKPQEYIVRPSKYFVAVDTDKVDFERPRETGEREFGPLDTSLDGYDSNLSDTRTDTGCIYYSGEPCIDVVTADRTIKPPKPEKYFCPGICDHMPPETPRETGLMYFSGAVSSSSSGSEFFDEEPARGTIEEYTFNLMDQRLKTGYLYFCGKKMYEGYAPVRYFCPGSCESLEPEPVRMTGSAYFGSDAVARMSSRLGFEANLSDMRTETGCRYYGTGPCVDVRGWDRVPRCLKWTCYQVAGWIESLGFSNYRDCFIDNNITGRRLILVDASTLPKLGITNFKHVKIIAEAIRDILQLEKNPWNRSIRLPPRNQLEMFLEKKCFSGVEANKMTIEKFSDDWEYLKFQPPLCNHASLLPRD